MISGVRGQRPFMIMILWKHMVFCSINAVRFLICLRSCEAHIFPLAILEISEACYLLGASLHGDVTD